MLLTITISISLLVIINFLLLKFSVNKTKQNSKINKKPVVLKPQIRLEEDTQILAPTGS